MTHTGATKFLTGIRSVLIILAGDPVDGRVEMRAGVLAELEPAPRPERPVLIIMRDFVHLHRGRVLADLRRQKEHGRVGPERSGQVDNFDRPRQQGGGEVRKDLVRAHLHRSSKVSSRIRMSRTCCARMRVHHRTGICGCKQSAPTRWTAPSAYPGAVQALRGPGIGRNLAPPPSGYMQLVANRRR